MAAAEQRMHQVGISGLPEAFEVFCKTQLFLIVDRFLDAWNHTSIDTLFSKQLQFYI